MDLRVRLPKPVAAAMEEVQREDPERLSRILLYAMTRQTIYDHLAKRRTLGEEAEHP